MNSDRLIAGLDIGSAKTTAIIAEVVGDLPKHPTLKVLGVGQARTTGMRRGVVSDIEETTRSIRQALQDAERMAGTQVQDLFATVMTAVGSGSTAQDANKSRTATLSAQKKSSAIARPCGPPKRSRSRS